ncbi:hypothetical protein A2U01_0102148 [Trifolium medium]|uniref:Uncharacterized protein n=1 Tax=Trifolium medium TaxID=97028 RepID=A0A392UYD8_9FABA|nr:hypothetical protein [Trifolium medium]
MLPLSESGSLQEGLSSEKGRPSAQVVVDEEEGCESAGALIVTSWEP